MHVVIFFSLSQFMTLMETIDRQREEMGHSSRSVQCLFHT